MRIFVAEGCSRTCGTPMHATTAFIPNGSVWYFALGSGFVFCGPARNVGDKAITAVLHIHDIFLTDVPKRNT